ncbi:undecaprenyl/decaprenyl-phosphate alpha-N-acetylglucosaminyl 1-phosphate transferase [Candidatus Falkowbacteria bacterium]|nr:undecaprenyl/decaprenyl-phosphate alpha-N-acetylglucosaminyl 1-phosphate transferase [Candidatus Falkowbacteria bacterium]
MIYFISLLTSFLFSVIITPVVIKLAVKLNIFDQPGERKIHKTKTPLLGGLAIFLAFSLVAVIFWSAGYISDKRILDINVFAILLAGAVLIIGGFLDDKYSLKPLNQLVFPLLATIIAISSGIKIQFITNPLGGILEFPAYLGIIMAFFWLIGMIYTTKLLDGLDGLVAGVTTIGSLVIFFVSLYWDAPLSGTSIMATVLAGSALGFLVFNFHPAKIFLGEGGSLFCGFMLGVLSIISGSKIATALLIMGIPILDVAWVILRRIWQGRSPATGDNQHLHFRLLNIGLSHRQAVILLYFLTGAFGITSLFLKSKGKIIALAILTIVMVVMAIGLVYIYKLKNKSLNGPKA